MRGVPDFRDLSPLVYVVGVLGIYVGCLMVLYEFTLRLEMLSLSRVTGAQCWNVLDVLGCFGICVGQQKK